MINYLKLFGAVTPGSAGNPCFLKQYGVYIPAEAAHAKEDIEIFLEQTRSTGVELNAAFHKSWGTVATISEEEHVTQQICHYLLNYGMQGLGLEPIIWVPIETLDVPADVPVHVIKVIDKEEALQRCLNLLNSVALTQETIEDIFAVLEDCKVNWEEVKTSNKEAQVFLVDKTGVLPEGEELFRYFIFKATGKTLVIRNEETYREIKDSGYILPKLSIKQMIGLAQSFNRYKNIWLRGFKSPDNATTINKISKLSKQHHRPMPLNVLGNLTWAEFEDSTIKAAAEKASVAELVKAINALRLYQQPGEDRLYQIRNGKIKTRTKAASLKELTLKEREVILLETLKGKLPRVTVYVPNNVSYGIPLSEKQMVGNFPQGTKIRVYKKKRETLLIGATWSRDDLDLSAISITGKTGWDAQFRNNSFLYSGDVTQGEQCAEWLYCKDPAEPNLIKLNIYTGNPKNIKFVVGISEKTEIEENYLVAPSEVVMEFPLQLEHNDTTIGLVINNEEYTEVYLYNLTTGSCNTSASTEEGKILLRALENKITSSLRLEELFPVVDTPEEADIDLTCSSISKDSILNLLN